VKTNNAGLQQNFQGFTTFAKKYNMKKYILFLLSLSTMLFACNDADKKTDEAQANNNERVIASTCEPNYWFNEQTLQSEVVHSAPFASKLDTTYNESYGFRSLCSRINNGIPRFVHVNFWAQFPTKDVTAKLVVSVDSVGKNKFWLGQDLKDSIKELNTWQRFNMQFTLNQNLSPEDQITIYVWSFDKKLLYIDDLELKFIK
jgi:hypothetical protein